MKLLAITDTHGSVKAERSLQALLAAERPDVVVCAGDYTVFGAYGEGLLAVLRECGLPVLYVYGNHEARAAHQKMEECVPGSMNLDARIHLIGETAFFGRGGHDMFTEERRNGQRVLLGPGVQASH